MKADDKTGEIVIYDEIGKSWWGEDTVSAKAFLDELAALGEVDQIDLRINSPGGDVFDGVAIHNAIKNHKANVTAYVDGLAASAASFIAMAANKIVMPANSFLLIHGASGFAFGNADDMRATAEDLDRIDKSLTATYAARSKSTTAKVKALMKEDRLMDAAEAKELGFADQVIAEKKMAANYPLRLLPQAAAEKFRAETGTGQGDPPPLVHAPEEPGGQPVDPPAPPPVPPPSPPPAPPPAPQRATAEVVDIGTAKAQGIAEHQAYVASITDLCTLAAAPERVGPYVRANIPVEQVRKELLALRADEPAVMPHHPLAEKVPVAKSWDKITDKINARKHPPK
jgi:ATP-dependent Clp endopeptidase proteolytic subunit ClpP